MEYLTSGKYRRASHGGNSMNEKQERKKSLPTNNDWTPVLDRTRGAKKPYEAPTLVKLGDVAKLTNQIVSVGM
ncbi:MAG: lasso RiPP family leader peptide-containing protein [Rectinemataceae bacterium]